MALIKKDRRLPGLAAAAGVLVVGVSLFAVGSSLAMPVQTAPEDVVPGSNGDGRLDINQVLDNATDMEIRLTKQIMLLQRQINDLQRQIVDMRDDQAE